MKKRFIHQIVFAISLVFHLPIGYASETSAPTDPNQYLNAVREFADNVLKFGRDTYSFITP